MYCMKRFFLILFCICCFTLIPLTGKSQRIGCNSWLDYVATGVKTAYLNQGKHNLVLGGFYTLGHKGMQWWHFAGANISYIDGTYTLKGFPSITLSYNLYKDKHDIGFTTKFNYTRYMQSGYTNSCFTPEIGLSMFGFTSITYGYNILSNYVFNLSKHQIMLTLYIPVWLDGSDSFY